MEVEIAVTQYIKVSVLEALERGRISWDYNVVSGIWAERYYLAERDDVFLEVSQEILCSDGSLHNHTLFYLECSDVSAGNNKDIVLKYILENVDRIIPYEEVCDYE